MSNGNVCITRKVGERVELVLPDGRKVEIRITSRANAQVKLGIHAPTDVQVLRPSKDQDRIDREAHYEHHAMKGRRVG